MAADSIKDRVARAIFEVMQDYHISSDELADRAAEAAIKVMNGGPLERIAASMEKIADAAANPRVMVRDGVVEPIAPLGEYHCPYCGGPHVMHDCPNWLRGFTAI